jgi:hypothetical protein
MEAKLATEVASPARHLEPRMSGSKQILEEMRQAVEGLTYPSESDEPFDVFSWDGKGTALQQVAAHAGKERKIEEVQAESFFSQLDDSDDAERYRHLQKLLTSSLRSFTIARVGAGEVRVDVYLIGKLATGEWTGLHTVSVET